MWFSSLYISIFSNLIYRADVEVPKRHDIRPYFLRKSFFFKLQNALQDGNGDSVGGIHSKIR